MYYTENTNSTNPIEFIKLVKEKSNIIDVATAYGISLDKTHKAKCVFHGEKTASMSFSQSKQIFHCFGCGIGGDCISLVANLLNITPFQAAIHINNTTNLGICQADTRVSKYERKIAEKRLDEYNKKKMLVESFNKWETETFKFLCDYLHVLEDWEEIKDPDNPFFIESIHNIGYIEYLLDDIFINGTEKDKISFWKQQQKSEIGG